MKMGRKTSFPDQRMWRGKQQRFGSGLHDSAGSVCPAHGGRKGTHGHTRFLPEAEQKAAG